MCHRVRGTQQTTDTVFSLFSSLLVAAHLFFPFIHLLPAITVLCSLPFTPHFNATRGGVGLGSGKRTDSKHPGRLRFSYLVPLTKFAASAQRWTWLRNRIEIQDTARASAPLWQSGLWIPRPFNPSMANPPKERDIWNQTRKYLCRRQGTRSTLFFSVIKILINNKDKS